jgi:hypothetical protein
VLSYTVGSLEGREVPSPPWIFRCKAQPVCVSGAICNIILIDGDNTASCNLYGGRILAVGTRFCVLYRCHWQSSTQRSNDSADTVAITPSDGQIDDKGKI